MTFQQIRKYIKLLLLTWFPNKQVLDKFSLSNDNKLTFNSETVYESDDDTVTQGEIDALNAIINGDDDT